MTDVLGSVPEGLRAGDGSRLRLLLVHAHPDDETLTTGATMARYAAEGAQVTLVTCTRGEKGEVIGPLGHLEGDDDALAEHRTGELAAAMAALGVTDHRFLGADAGVRFRDSGMVWGEHGRAVVPPDVAPDAFASLPADEVAAHLVRVVDEVRPHVLVTYDAEGGYGHPDHVQAHRVSLAAAAAAGWRVEQVLAVASPRSVHEAGVARLRGLGPGHGRGAVAAGRGRGRRGHRPGRRRRARGRQGRRAAGARHPGRGRRGRDLLRAQQRRVARPRGHRVVPTAHRAVDAPGRAR